MQKKILLLSSAEEDHDYENNQALQSSSNLENRKKVDEKISESGSEEDESQEFNIQVVKAAYSTFKSEELIQIKKFS